MADIIQTIGLEGQDDVVKGFGEIGDAGEEAFKKVADAVAPIGEALSAVGDKVKEAMEAMAGSADAVKESFSNAKPGEQLKPEFDKIKEGAEQSGHAIAELGEKIGGAFKGLSGVLGEPARLFGEIATKAGEAVSAITGAAGGISGAFKAIGAAAGAAMSVIGSAKWGGEQVESLNQFRQSLAMTAATYGQLKTMAREATMPMSQFAPIIGGLNDSITRSSTSLERQAEVMKLYEERSDLARTGTKGLTDAEKEAYHARQMSIRAQRDEIRLHRQERSLLQSDDVATKIAANYAKYVEGVKLTSGEVEKLSLQMEKQKEMPAEFRALEPLKQLQALKGKLPEEEIDKIYNKLAGEHSFKFKEEGIDAAINGMQKLSNLYDKLGDADYQKAVQPKLTGADEMAQDLSKTTEAWDRMTSAAKNTSIAIAAVFGPVATGLLDGITLAISGFGDLVKSAENAFKSIQNLFGNTKEGRKLEDENAKKLKELIDKARENDPVSKFFSGMFNPVASDPKAEEERQKLGKLIAESRERGGLPPPSEKELREQGTAPSRPKPVDTRPQWQQAMEANRLADERDAAQRRAAAPPEAPAERQYTFMDRMLGGPLKPEELGPMDRLKQALMPDVTPPAKPEAPAEPSWFDKLINMLSPVSPAKAEEAPAGAAASAAGSLEKVSAPADAAAASLDKVASPADAAASAMKSAGDAAEAFASKLASADVSPSSKAEGGVIGGWGSGKSDNNIIRASKGEFIVTADGSNLGDAVAHFGGRGLQGYAEGGVVGSDEAKEEAKRRKEQKDMEYAEPPQSMPVQPDIPSMAEGGTVGESAIQGQIRAIRAQEREREMKKQLEEAEQACMKASDYVGKFRISPIMAYAHEMQKAMSRMHTQAVASGIGFMGISGVGGSKYKEVEYNGRVMSEYDYNVLMRRQREQYMEAYDKAKEAEKQACDKVEEIKHKQAVEREIQRLEEQDRANKIAAAREARESTDGRLITTGATANIHEDTAGNKYAAGGLVGSLLGYAQGGAVGGCEGGNCGGHRDVVSHLARAFVSGGLVDGFVNTISGIPGYAEGGPVNGGRASGANTLGYHQLDIRTNAGAFSANVNEDTMTAIRNSSLGGKLSQTGQRPSWYS